MPKQARALFLLLGYAANQINMLFKLIIFSTNKTPDDVEQFLSGAQSQMLARFAIGALHEAWELIRKGLLNNRIGSEYTEALDSGGRTALDQLKKLFGGSNILSKLRNDFVFHHPYDIPKMDAAFEAAANDAAWDNDWNWYFSKSNLNSFYFLSDFVVMHGIARSVGETDLITAQKKIMAEVKTASQAMTELIKSLTALFWRKHFGSEMTGELCAIIDTAPKDIDVWIPFFIEIPDDEAPVARKIPGSYDN